MCNCIIVGFCDVFIVVEIQWQGGFMISVKMVNDYYCDVFVVFGWIWDRFLVGCNLFIKSYWANLLESVDDFVYVMCWEKLDV